MGNLAMMSAPTTNTKRRTVHCSKHAFAPIASFRPKNAVVPSVTLPAQRHQSGLGRAGLASESPFTGDDPVNGVDPLGLWPSLSDLNPVHDAEALGHTATRAWNDTGGKVVSAVDQHWRGIVQGVITVAGVTAIITCTVATDGVCALAVEVAGADIPVGSLLTSAAIGASERAAEYAVSAECHTVSGYLQQAGIGAGLGLTEGVGDEVSPLGVAAKHAVPTGFWQTLTHLWAG